MGRRSLITLLIVLALSGIVATGRPTSVAHGASTAKKTCKYVKKKVHGKKKKVKVCTNTTVKTATPTNTPTPTPTPTNTPTATPTPTNTRVVFNPAPVATNTSTDSRFLSLFTDGEARVIDTVTNVRADVVQYETGLVDRNGNTPPPGQMYVWIFVREWNFGQTPYTSRYLSFKLLSSDGTEYGPSPNAPADQDGDIFSVLTLNYNEYTTGWLEFQVPTRKDTYQVLWTENNVIPQGVEFDANIDVNPGSAAEARLAARFANSGSMPPAVGARLIRMPLGVGRLSPIS